MVGVVVVLENVPPEAVQLIELNEDVAPETVDVNDTSKLALPDVTSDTLEGLTAQELTHGVDSLTDIADCVHEADFPFVVIIERDKTSAPAVCLAVYVVCGEDELPVAGFSVPLVPNAVSTLHVQ